MFNATKSNSKALTASSPAQTPSCTPINNSPQQSVTPGDDYQHFEVKKLVEALREISADFITSKPNPSKDTARRPASPKQESKDVHILTCVRRPSSSKPKQEPSCNSESESPVPLDKYTTQLDVV
ncbi:hypothetical protein AJ78_08528 [Emergomyces pasteurianus Ep9510]|uniref:Uncharacterized protein n=1 Tax=Emergomyces pasteurianus Ep9510 TaxID=1447872 RepID=A0A1J9P2T1_9EURO|nr:hypothetical protein AJ78_08528 [Emergomyces pasteurianus Ep9510]